MTSGRARWLLYRSVLAVASVIAAVLPSGVVVVAGDAQITVMTRNLYVGAGLGDAFGASSWPELTAAGSNDWAHLLASDFPTRAEALADEVARARPDVLGLQEVTLWRDQTPSDVQTQPTPNATHVAFDFLAILQEQLGARGTPYTAVATSTNVDIEFPRLDPGGGLVDLRITDRDVLMVRTDLAERAENPRAGHYTAQFSEPFLTGPVTSTRGWTSIDYWPEPTTTVRIFDTHLELGGPTQELQADETLSMVAASPYPVIALGDFNAPADSPAAPAYQKLTAVLHDAWTTARPGDPGWTCCQALEDAARHENVRIDLVLTSEDWPVTLARRTGDQPFRAAPPPLWASDHFGVTARVVIPRK
jgi:endonuclease/exonuclease/phosphatase family metal-dependent hydrolase